MVIHELAQRITNENGTQNHYTRHMMINELILLIFSKIKSMVIKKLKR